MSTPGSSHSGSVSKRLTFFSHNIQNTIQRAGSVITSSLRSCDDATEVLTSAGNEFLVARQADHAFTERKSVGAESLAKRLAVAAHDSKTSSDAQIWGDHRFKLSLTWSPAEGKRDKDSICGTVNVAGWMESTHGGRTDIPLRILWQRRCADQVFPVAFTGASFPVTADDICCHIRVQVTASQAPELGTAFAEIGPFDVDAAMRGTLQDYLHNGGATFLVELLEDSAHTASSTLDADEKSYTLSLSATELKLIKPGPKNVGYTRSWVAGLASQQSLVELDLSHHAGFKLSLKLDDGNIDAKAASSVIRVAALSRRQRDTIVLAIRAFQSSLIVNTIALLEQIALNTQQKDPGFHATDDQKQRTKLDFYLIYDQLNRQTTEALKIAAAASKEKNRAVAERDALEQDINATIDMYQRLLEDAGSSSQRDDTSKITMEITQRAAQFADLQSKNRDLQMQVSKYMSELELVRRDLRDARKERDEKARQLAAWLESPPVDATTSRNGRIFGDSLRGDDKMRVIELEGQLRQLENLNFTLTHEKKTLEKQISHVGESAEDKVRVAALEAQVAVLEEQLKKLETDKSEAEQNFLYIKQRYDELEKQQRAAAMNSMDTNSAVERAEKAARREIDMHQTRIKELQLQLADRTRQLDEQASQCQKLQKQNESLNREKDKWTSSHQRHHSSHGGTLNLGMVSQIPTVTQRDNTTQCLIDLNRTLLMPGATLNGTAVDDHFKAQLMESVNEMQTLTTKLASAQAEVRALRAENEELKAKCRKLAVA